MFDLKRFSRYNILQSEWARLILILFVAAAMIAVSAIPVIRERMQTIATAGRHVLVIDPGHGGFDGGAISDDGSKESDINLAIGLKMRALAELAGLRTVMTRSDDRARTDYDGYSEHEDLVLRTAIANNTPGPSLCVCIKTIFLPGSPAARRCSMPPHRGASGWGRRCTIT